MLSMHRLFENIFFSSDDVYYNFDKWVNSKDGKLCVTGYTGSGKTTISRQLAKKYNVKLIQLDSYININKDKIDKLVKQKRKAEIHKYYQTILNSKIEFLLNSKQKLIIEGIQLFLYSDTNKLKNDAVIVRGTSSIVSFIRAYKRNCNEDWAKDWNVIHIILDIYHNSFIRIVEKFIRIVTSWSK